MALNAELEAVVEQRTHELADRNRNIQDSIDYALTIQRAQLPSRKTRCKSSWGTMLP